MDRVRTHGRRVKARLRAPGDRGNRPAHDQLHERHHGQAEGRDDHASQRVGKCRRHARPLPHHGRRPVPVDAADVPRQRLDVRVDHHRRRGHPHLPAEGGACARLRPDPQGEGRMAVRRADCPDRSRQRSWRCARRRARRRARHHRGSGTRRRDHRASGRRARLGGDPGLRPHRDSALHHHLRATARAQGARQRPSSGSSRPGPGSS